MIQLEDIDKYQRKGRGKVFQFYITQDELLDAVNELEQKFNSKFSIIVSDWDKNTTNWTFSDHEIKELPSLIKKGHFLFMLRSLALSPKINIIKNGSYRADYYMYNGILQIKFNQKERKLGNSFLMFIDKVENRENPEEIIYNIDYQKIYNFLKRKIKLTLKHKGYSIGKTGKIYEADNISIGHKEGFLRGTIKSPLEKIE